MFCLSKCAMDLLPLEVLDGLITLRGNLCFNPSEVTVLDISAYCSSLADVGMKFHLMYNKFSATIMDSIRILDIIQMTM